MIVKSPTYGRVEDIHTDTESIGIYIALEDPHSIHAPISGTVIALDSDKGTFQNPPPYWKKTWTEQTENKSLTDITLYHVDSPKTERLWIAIESGPDTLYFYIEVGSPKYVTNNIALYVQVGQTVSVGDEIGQILMGSRSRVFIPLTGTILHDVNITVKQKQKLEGGKTIIMETQSRVPTKRLVIF